MNEFMGYQIQNHFVVNYASSSNPLRDTLVWQNYSRNLLYSSSNSLNL